MEIKKVTDKGVEIAIVIGGGNIFRGLSGASDGMDRVQGDHMGMLATVINGLALQSALENEDVPTRLQSAININEVAEPFIRTSDPEKDKLATKFDFISFEDVLQKGLKVMDTTAFTLSQENELPIIVFDMNTQGNLLKVVSGENIGTKVNL